MNSNNFKNKDLFDLALTHRSWLNEHKGLRGSNERLEFLGDAVLEFIVSKELYTKFPDQEEGYLTALRANIVNTVSLAEIAKKLDLGSILHVSKGEEESGGRTNTSLLADTVEAIIGAIYIDRGIDEAEKFIQENLLIDLDSRASQPLKDFKSRLQELVQGQSLPTPKYQVVEESGPDHDKKFIIEVTVQGESWGKGEGKSKSTAEQDAARQALDNKVK
ncbi:MAG TPA: ribonuclease III [Alphaproteobacteria bacterium]|jgi:ribonuclease-3|nr:ribonuclease III [Alphaproteobacteria bacterium]